MDRRVAVSYLDTQPARPMIPPDQLESGPYEFAGHTFHRQDINPASISIRTVLTRDGRTTRVDSNGSRWGGQPPLHLDDLLSRLRSEPLDRRMSPFVHAFGTWGTEFFGNFAFYSHGFMVITDDPVVDDVLRRAIRSNVHTAAYRALPRPTRGTR